MAALPFAVMIQALCATELRPAARVRRNAFLAGLAMFLPWGIAVRGGIVPDAATGLVPAAMALTVALSLWQRFRLARAVELQGRRDRPLAPPSAATA